MMDTVDSLGHPMECFAWIAVFDGEQIGVARTASFTLPNLIRDLIMEEGMELGDADDHGRAASITFFHTHSTCIYKYIRLHFCISDIYIHIYIHTLHANKFHLHILT